MTVAQPMSLCGAKTRSGAACTLPAGWGTETPGVGRCRKHGGNTPNGRMHAAKAEARELIAGLAIAEEVDPTDSLLWALYVSFGQLKAATAAVAGLDGFESPRATFWLRTQSDALERVARFSEMALRQGIAEKRLRLIERMAERISAAAEDALQAFSNVTPEERAAFVQRFTGRLAVLGSGDDE